MLLITVREAQEKSPMENRVRKNAKENVNWRLTRRMALWGTIMTVSLWPRTWRSRPRMDRRRRVQPCHRSLTERVNLIKEDMTGMSVFCGSFMTYFYNR